MERHTMQRACTCGETFDDTAQFEEHVKNERKEMVKNLIEAHNVGVEFQQYTEYMANAKYADFTIEENAKICFNGFDGEPVSVKTVYFNVLEDAYEHDMVRIWFNFE